jgi:hypothetical protein
MISPTKNLFGYAPYVIFKVVIFSYIHFNSSYFLSIYNLFFPKVSLTANISVLHFSMVLVAVYFFVYDSLTFLLIEINYFYFSVILDFI